MQRAKSKNATKSTVCYKDHEDSGIAMKIRKKMIVPVKIMYYDRQNQKHIWTSIVGIQMCIMII